MPLLSNGSRSPARKGGGNFLYSKTTRLTRGFTIQKARNSYELRAYLFICKEKTNLN